MVSYFQSLTHLLLTFYKKIFLSYKLSILYLHYNRNNLWKYIFLAIWKFELKSSHLLSQRWISWPMTPLFFLWLFLWCLTYMSRLTCTLSLLLYVFCFHWNNRHSPSTQLFSQPWLESSYFKLPIISGMVGTCHYPHIFLSPPPPFILVLGGSTL
jgi:hypothetical protein